MSKTSVSNVLVILLLMMVTHHQIHGEEKQPSTASHLAYDIYHGCLKDLQFDCVDGKVSSWLRRSLHQNEIPLSENLAIIRTGKRKQLSANLSEQEQMMENVEQFLDTHALRIRAPEYFQTDEARSLMPNFILDNPLTKGAVVPLTDVAAEHEEGRGFIRKAVLPFLIGLKLKTTVLMPLILGLIALKTWKAMTLGLLSLVLSGALVIFKISKPKIVNYEVVHYPHHVDHVPHHIDHIVPHHVDHLIPHHHLDHHHVDHHHLDLPHHVDHVDHLDHASPVWEPHSWARSSQEVTGGDAQELAFAGQKRR